MHLALVIAMTMGEEGGIWSAKYPRASGRLLLEVTQAFYRHRSPRH